MPDTPHPLGRQLHPLRDPRDAGYRVRALAAPVYQSVRWHTNIGTLKQDIGSCTGNGAVGLLGHDPLWAPLSPAQRASLGEPLAVSIYSEATRIDPYAGEYPPTDTGSDGPSVAKVTRNLGLCSGWLHGYLLDELLAALQTGPAMVGTVWLNNMFDPAPDGQLTVSGPVAGGHEYVVDEVDVERRRVWIHNSWGDGWGVQGRAWMSFDDMARLLADDGDVTVLQPLQADVPPDPGAASFPWPATPVGDRMARAATRAGLTVDEYARRRMEKYYGM